MTDVPITQKRANKLIEPFCGTKSAEYIKSLRGYTRYLAQLDNPDKAQYDAGIVALGGTDLVDALRRSLSDHDKHQIIGEIICYCEESGTHEFSALIQHAMRGHEDWFPIIVNKAYFVTRLLDSLRYANRR